MVARELSETVGREYVAIALVVPTEEGAATVKRLGQRSTGGDLSE